MNMPTALARFRQKAVIAALALLAPMHAAQAAIARTPTISGNGWAALGVIAFLVGLIWLLISGALHLERRDASLGRGRRSSDNGWFGIFPNQLDDEDAPDYQNHDGGEGGESG